MATICFAFFSHSEMSGQRGFNVLLIPTKLLVAQNRLAVYKEEEEVPANQSQASVGQASNIPNVERDSDGFND